MIIAGMNIKYLFCQVALLVVIETVLTATWYNLNENTVLGDVSGTAAEGPTLLKPRHGVNSLIECALRCKKTCKKRPFYVETAKQCYCLGDGDDESKIAITDAKKKGSMAEEVVNKYFFFSVFFVRKAIKKNYI